VQNLDEAYNPDKHCCKWWYKDYCECVKAANKQYRKDCRDKAVNMTEKWLIKNRVNFQPTSIPNVVKAIIGNDTLYVSLKSPRDAIKCRYEGRNKWYTYNKSTLIERIKQL